MGLEILHDDISVSDYHLSPTERPDIPTPEQEVESIVVEGRHGSLTRLGEFKDIPFSIEYNLLENSNIKSLLRNIRGYFFGKKRLRFSDDPNFYYRIKSLKISDTNNQIEEYGLFKVDYICDPFQYEFTGDIVLNNNSILINRGTIDSEPLLKVYGSGNSIVTINGHILKLNNLSDYISVDCELKEAHKNGVSKNSDMVGDFPVFKVGENTISWNAAVTKMVVEPRWRYI